MTCMEKAYHDLSKELAGENVIETLLLSADQMLIHKHLAPNSEPAGFKAPTLIPTVDGFAIYVTCQAPGTGEERPQQQITFPAQPVMWNPATMSLRLDRTTLDQRWLLLNQAGERITVSSHCGSEQVFVEVDRVLALVAAVLFG